MIVFDLECQAHGHRFEGWFGSSDDYTTQQKRGLLTCPECNSADIIKAPMAPNLARKGNQIIAHNIDKPIVNTEVSAEIIPTQTAMPAPPAFPPSAFPPSAFPPPELPAEAIAVLTKIAKLQAEALKQSRWVGEKFTDNARAMHYGETEAEQIHGEATAKEAQELMEEGIEIALILFPINPKEKSN